MWTGQCLACNGIETLETSWLLRSFVDSCIDKWKSTRIGGSCDSFGGFFHFIVQYYLHYGSISRLCFLYFRKRCFCT